MQVLEKGNKIKGKKIALTTIPETTPDNLQALGPCFYKLIVAPSTQSHNLRIPEKYVRTYYEEQLANDYAKLSVNDGKVWRVELFKEGGKVWLSKGWECFVKNYSLKYGYFLLFRYDEVKYEYHVTIFDMTCFEIEYDQEFDNHTKDQEVIKISPQEE
uniref:TF-B3 domain-containing protein n=1 Tax=Chenopodium quinoa TaxID=63459 RepID=A0A803L2N1_CHEQI